MTKLGFLLVIMLSLGTFLWGQEKTQKVSSSEIIFGKDSASGIFRLKVKIPQNILAPQIAVEDFSQSTFAHFLIPSSEKESYFWYGRFYKSGKVVLEGRVFSAAQPYFSGPPRWKEVITLPDAKEISENEDLEKGWEESAHHFREQILQVYGSDPYLEYQFFSAPWHQEKIIPLGENFQVLWQEKPRFFLSPLPMGTEKKDHFTRHLMQNQEKDPATIPLEECSLPEVPSATKSRKKQEKLFSPLVQWIPYDSYYVHFSSLRGINSLLERVLQYDLSALDLTQKFSHHSDPLGKIFSRLAIAPSSGSEEGKPSLLPNWLNIFIGQIAFSGTDLLWEEGNEVALWLEVKRPFFFDYQINNYFRQAKKKGAHWEKKTYREVPYEAIFQEDGEISCYTCYLGKYRVFSVSESYLQKIIDVEAGKQVALGDTVGFRRGRTAFSKGEELVFIHWPEAGWKSLCQASYLISKQRRTICTCYQKGIRRALTAYYQKFQKWATWQNLVESKFILTENVSCPEGGKYKVEKDKVSCSLHQHPGCLTPVNHLEVVKVNLREKEMYEEFFKDYQTWGKFIGDFSLQVRGGKKLRFSSFIPLKTKEPLPSFWNDILNSSTSEFYLPQTLFSVGGKVDEKWWNQILLAYKEFLPKHFEEEFFAALGEGGRWHVCDGEILFPIDYENWSEAEQHFDFWLAPLTFLRLPGYLTWKVKSLSKWSDLQEKLHSHLLFWQKKYLTPLRVSLNIFKESYQKKKYTVYSLRFFSFKLRLYLYNQKDHFVLSNQETIVQDWIRGKMKRVKRSLVSWYPRNSPQLYAFLEQEKREQNGRRCLRNLSPLLHLEEVFSLNPSFSGNFNTFSEKLYGHKLLCPSGGSYHYQPWARLFKCSVHGDVFRQKQAEIKNKTKSVIENISFTSNLEKNHIEIEITIDDNKTSK